MDSDICAMEELAAAEWRAGHRVKVPLVYQVGLEIQNTLEKELKAADLPKIAPETQESCLSSGAMEEDLRLKNSHKDIMKRVSERYKTEELKNSKPPKFPEFPPLERSCEMEIVESLRPHGVRFIHYPENYADCSCCIPPQLMNYFEQRIIKPPFDRFEDDYFGDVNFQRFLKGLSDQFALLHHSRTFTVVGIFMKTWYIVTYDSEIMEHLFEDRLEFVAMLRSRLEESCSKAWSRSFLMCPSPYPQSFVLPLREKDENILLQHTYQRSLVLTSSPELQREADPITELDRTICLDDSFNSSVSHVHAEIFEMPSFCENFKKNSPVDRDPSPVSSLEGELPIDSLWLEASFENSDGEFQSQDDSAHSSGALLDFFSTEDTVEDEVYFCLQEMLAAILSDCTCPQHENREILNKAFIVFDEFNTSTESDLVPTLCPEPTKNARSDSEDRFKRQEPRTPSMDEFDPLIAIEDIDQEQNRQSEAQTSLLDLIDSEQLIATEFDSSEVPPILQPEAIVVSEDPRSTLTDGTELEESRSSLVEFGRIESLQCREVTEQPSATPSDFGAKRIERSDSSDSLADDLPGEESVWCSSPRRPSSDPPLNSEVELTPCGASFRITSPKRCISLPCSGLGPSREESLFLADTIAKLRPFGVRFIADMNDYQICTCRPCSAISKLWERSEKLRAIADFDMDRFGDMLLANFIAARDRSAALLLHYAGSFDMVAVDKNHWTYVHDDCGDVQSHTFEGEEPLFSLIEKRISRKFNSQTLLEKFTCPLPEGMTPNDSTSSMMKRTLKVKENMKANMAKKLTTLENQKEILGKKFASFMTRLSH